MPTCLSPMFAAVLAGVLVLGAPQGGHASDSSAVFALRNQVELAYRAGSQEGLQSAQAALMALAGSEPRSAYYLAYVHSCQGMLAAADAGTARRLMDDCIARLNDYLPLYPEDAEARALLGSCNGVSTRYHRLTMVKRGLAAQREIAAARQLAPDNPWVVLQDGLADFSTPAVFGGDRSLAIRKLERATDLFAAAVAAGTPLAAWGAAEAWNQLGQMYRQAGRPADAFNAFQREQALAPGSPTQLASR
ncbi:MAG: hypothetical protein FJ197_10765 [Gammaproteobacteria bacterium]|nr:hypothetical protein [Gammaproteobacteria bacterium]